MTLASYSDFLPSDRRGRATEPDEDWWEWRGHRIHVARARRPEARVRVLVVHGAGGHSGALWPVASAVVGDGVELAALDLPLYGRTRARDARRVRYDDWVELLTEFVAAEDDGRPLILFGASLGGMLAYEIGARSDAVAAVAATCLLDPRDRRVRMRMTRFGALGALAGMLRLVARGSLSRVMVPIRWVAPLKKMSRNPGLSRLCERDPLGGGASVPLGFLASLMTFRHTPPEANGVRLVLTHPAEDAWTPAELSIPVAERAAGVSDVVLLGECGHFPVEEPGLTELEAALSSLVASTVD